MCASLRINKPESYFDLKISIASTSSLAIPTLDLLHKEGHFLSLITKPRTKSGRGRSEKITEIEERASQLNIEVFYHDNDQGLSDFLSKNEIDLVITIAYGKLINEPSLSTPRYGWLNLHFSLLPKFRGAAPVQRAILAGENKTGITIFKLDNGMDTGPIYLQQQYDISNLNTGEVLDFFAKLGALAFIEVLKDISNESTPIAQSGEASLARKVLKEEAEINWHNEAAFNERKIRAFTPKPGAWTNFGGKRLRIEKARLSADSGSPGTILKLDPLLVACKEGAIEILSVCPEGSRSMDAQDWIRGARISSGASFG
jgi:methionyl-tRNA formyltransferase